MEELSRGLVFLQPPDRGRPARGARSQPIEMVGYRFESAAMIDDMLDALAGTPGALPLLQFAAAKLWDARDRTAPAAHGRELPRDRRHQRRARDARRRRRRAA